MNVNRIFIGSGLLLIVATVVLSAITLGLLATDRVGNTSEMTVLKSASHNLVCSCKCVGLIDPPLEETITVDVPTGGCKILGAGTLCELSDGSEGEVQGSCKLKLVKK